MIKEKLTKLKSHSRLVARIMFWIWAVGWLALALCLYPIWWSEAADSDVAVHYVDSNISYVLNSWFDTEKEFTWVWTLTICDPTDPDTCITMFDRNLWATTNNINQTGSYWYHFQWWNNYWFESCYTEGCVEFPWLESATSTKFTWCSLYWPTNPFSSWLFVGISYTNDWCNPWYGNLWWWNWDNNTNWYWLTSTNPIEWRQWPCPEWSHVPSIGEWDAVLEWWLGYNSGTFNLTNFSKNFKIPFAGYRYYNKKVLFVENKPLASIWTSSPYSTQMAYIVLLDSYSYGNDVNYVLNAQTRVNGYSVRCFTDVPMDFSAKYNEVFFYDESGTNIVYSGLIESWTAISNSWGMVSIISWYENSRDGYAISGWYISWTDSLMNFDDPITTGLELIVRWNVINYSITTNLFGWILETWKTNPSNYTIEIDNITLNNPMKVWYAFLWWSGTDIEWVTWTVIISNWSTWNRVYEANWEAIEYTLTVDLWNWMTQTITWHYGDPIDVPQDPTRDWYSFAGWSIPFPTTMPAEDQTITAQWTKNQTPQSYWWGGGGWWSSRVKDNCPNWDFSNSYYDGKCGEKVSTWSIEDWDDWEDWDDLDEKRHNAAEEVEYDILKFDPNYSDEMNQAYQYSYANGITTMDSIDKADMRWSLTRVAMAKMLSKYAINVLWMVPDMTRQNKFVDVSNRLDLQYDSWVTLAYQLWIMWINMPNNKFRPYDLVPRSEFVTALSRMKYNTSDGQYAWTSEFYRNHMDLLEKLWIVTNTDSKMLEVRWYVMLMLLRTSRN